MDDAHIHMCTLYDDTPKFTLKRTWRLYLLNGVLWQLIAVLIVSEFHLFVFYVPPYAKSTLESVHVCLSVASFIILL